MTAALLSDIRVLFAGADLAGTLTKYSYEVTMEPKESTPFRTGLPAVSVPNSAKVLYGGLETGSMKLSGASAAGSSDDEAMPDDLASNWLGSPAPVTAAPDGDALGDVAYLAELTPTKYNIINGSVGDVWSYEIEGTSSNNQRGVVALPMTAIVSSGHGDAVHLGAVVDGKRLHATAHVVARAGSGTVTFAVESSASALFTSPTTELTFDAMTDLGAGLERTDGTAITNTYYRLKWTATLGVDEAFAAFAALAIG